ncbi:hypothetical protein [Mycolicibacterium palauense]|uniref:hypothetical protein n=1 Tax=Mycolicibacterium palauense TaxID=2034511 RepID=UPI000BFED517|nr:hypothetical protein [Mycolicibacterium palauense]
MDEQIPIRADRLELCEDGVYARESLPAGLPAEESTSFLNREDLERAFTEGLDGLAAECRCGDTGRAGYHLSMLELDDEVMVGVRCSTCGGVCAIGTDQRSGL